MGTGHRERRPLANNFSEIFMQHCSTQGVSERERAREGEGEYTEDNFIEIWVVERSSKRAANDVQKDTPCRCFALFVSFRFFSFCALRARHYNNKQCRLRQRQRQGQGLAAGAPAAGVGAKQTVCVCVCPRRTRSFFLSLICGLCSFHFVYFGPHSPLQPRPLPLSTEQPLNGRQLLHASA